MSSGWRAFVAAGDRPAVRLAVAFAIAVVVWAAWLVRFARLFADDGRPARPAESIEMQLVEIAPPVPERQPEVRPSAPAQAKPARDVPKPSRVAAAPAERRDTREPAAAERVPQADTPRPPQDESAMTTAHAEPSAAASAASQASPASRSASGDTTAAPPGATQARLLSQPLPVLPEDLREEAYRADAVARFDVHPDGSSDVELIKPTQNPRLNQILLEALHQWRFFPALENGRPVESHRDVRVHFNVS